MKPSRHKKYFKLITLTTSLFMANYLHAANTNLSGGTVNFNGSVVTSACAIGGNSADINVEMGQVRTAVLTEPGSVAGSAKAFSIILEDCEIADVSKSTEENPVEATSVSITFSGTPDANDPNALAVGANGGSASAQNVAIRLYDESGNALNLGQPANAVELRSGPNTLNFSARYYSPKGRATAGDASAVATYTVTYL